jgi:hypothetical protein
VVVWYVALAMLALLGAYTVWRVIRARAGAGRDADRIFRRDVGDA